MKMIGLIGGMSWESTLLYYRMINAEVNNTMGGLHSARLLMYSFDFDEIVSLQKAGAWEQAGQKLADAGRSLKAAGAEALVICTNTMHVVAHVVEEATGLPVLHIADCTALEIQQHKLTTVGLLGTAFTMEKEFYKGRFEDKFGIRILVPDEKDRAIVHRVIFEELCKGVVNPESRREYVRIIRSLKDKGAEAVILGCTEICMLMDEDTCEGLPMFNTTLIHAQKAAQYAMERDVLREAV